MSYSSTLWISLPRGFRGHHYNINSGVAFQMTFFIMLYDVQCYCDYCVLDLNLRTDYKSLNFPVYFIHNNLDLQTQFLIYFEFNWNYSYHGDDKKFFTESCQRAILFSQADDLRLFSNPDEDTYRANISANSSVCFLPLL